ncbi:MAG: ATP-dependent Clp protease proteolytic subunit [Planctomycetes bacterium]|jgi:ATP-dependent Clp protease protease subunit|nr:ATP-dependent Clp protease proteolytic subunit [Planctomycetota bacterium]MCL4730514.1 ATP-dependent Clp protease proteolytic subunit [Planctomycetota bacterium]
MLDFDPHTFRLEDDEDEKSEKGEGKQPAGLASKLLKSRTIIISKQVDDKLAAGVIAQLRILEDDDPNKIITVLVNSPGGSADSGFAIMDYMRFVKPPVRSIVCGICASAAVMIHLGSDKDERYCTPNSRFLLHQPSMSARGQASDLEILSAEIERIKLQYNKIVAEETGRKLAQIEKDVHRDFWIPADGAVEYGLVKKVIAHRGELD